jgi:hypothetical protein
MNPQLKTILLTVLTLSVFAIALVELSGVSSTAFVNKYGAHKAETPAITAAPVVMDEREKQIAGMPKTTIKFMDSLYNFGNIKEGDVVKHAFKFKNTGTAPLLIAKAEASCGCTVPTFSKEPIAPGGEGEIMVEFNSANKSGHQRKNVMVYSNAQMEKMSVGFEADVTAK